MTRLIDDKRPKLPVDISPLVQLCQEHADEITEDDWWFYRYFYLELLDQEETLHPLFWGTRDVAVQLREDDVVAAHLSGVPPSRPPTIKRLLNDLDKHEVIFLHDREAIALLVQTLNAAVHGAGVGDSAASWAMDVGPRILSGLDELIARQVRKEKQTND